MKYFLFFLFAFGGFAQSSTVIFETPLSPRNANYDIEARLFPEEKMVRATQILKWRNITSKPTSEVQFHMYLNGFKSYKTTFVAESGGSHRGNGFNPKYPGYNEIKSFSINGVDMKDRITFIQPDDNNKNDSTVFVVKLDRPVKPNEELTIDIEFEAKLPKVFARTGHGHPRFSPNYFLVGQWFPKIGVLEEAGWNCHQFHVNTEFFSDYGVYNVELTVPKEFVVGATGILVEENIDDSLATYLYHAEDVHDFVWTAYPKFKIYTEQYKDVAIRFLYNPGEEEDVEAQVQSLRYGLDFFQEKFGKYPYPNITFLNPPKGAEGSGGMEYPTFFTAGIISRVPNEIKFRHEVVTIHEFGHQIFYGILGTNEFESSWMDEGLNSFGQMGTIDKYYGGVVVYPDFLLENKEMDRMQYLAKPNHESVLKTSYKQSPSNYAANSYPRPSVLLETLRRYLGDKKFDAGMRNYYNKWKFKHPAPNDFFDALEEGTGENLSWYFEQYFRDNRVFDYEVKSITYDQIKSTNFVDLGYQKAGELQINDSSKIYYNRVVLINNGNGYFPVEFVVTLEDETTYSDLKWNVKENYNIIEFYSNSPLKKAQLDPERKAWIDLNFSNNGKEYNAKNGSVKFVHRWRYWASNILQLLNAL
jgi:hypothetical protein